MGHLGAKHALQESSPEAYRAMVIEETAAQLEAARQTAASRLEGHTVRLIAAMNSRAKESFAPWMYEYGQSVKLDLARTQTEVREAWELPKGTDHAVLTADDIALVKSRYGAAVATQRHFQNMMVLLQVQAREDYRQDVRERIGALRADVGTALGHSETDADKRRWADQYFAKLERATLSSQPTLAATPASGLELVYYTAFLSSIPKLASEDPLPASIATAISSARAEPDQATSAAALVLTWYVAKLNASDAAGMAKLSSLLDQHFDSLLQLVLRDPLNGLVARLKLQHAELLEMSRAS